MMNIEDMISRQAIIDALWTERQKLDAFMEECLKKGDMNLRARTKIERNRIEEDIYIIKNMPLVKMEVRQDKSDKEVKP